MSNIQAAQLASGIVPFDFKQARPDAAFLQGGYEDESLSDGIGSSYAVLHYKGKNWTLRYRGESYLFVRPDDGTPISYIDVIIIRQARVKAKSFYPGGYVDGQSEGKRPTCASIDGVRPDSDVAQAEAQVCAVCPRNEWKTMPNGKKGRECTDYKRLAVLLLPAATTKLLGEPLLEPVFLRVPPASLNDLALYGENMNSQGWPYFALVTRISFDPQQAHPKFQFRALQALTAKEAPLITKLRDDTLSKRITGEDQIAAAAGAPINALNGSTAPQAALAPPTSVLEVAPQPQQPAPQTVQAPPPPAPQQEIIPPKPAAAAAPPPRPQPPTIDNMPIDTGFGALTTGVATSGPPPRPEAGTQLGQPVAAPAQTTAPEAEGSNPELDAKIAALLNTAA